MSTPVAVRHVGLITSVGGSAASACAAIRARVTNPSETRFLNSAGEWHVAHQVTLAQPWVGQSRLAKMAALAIEECLANTPRHQWPSIPMLLCTAERERPGRHDGLDAALFRNLCEELGSEFADHSFSVPLGRVSVLVALNHARELLAKRLATQVLIVATDSLLTWPTLSVYERDGRLLASNNSNGFVPGEGAGALLIDSDNAEPLLLCTGVGVSHEARHIYSQQPLRAEGLTQAIQNAVRDASCDLQDVDFRITDLSGEQYYFKEAALALQRSLRTRRVEFDLWHPAECIGESGALAGLACIALADAACRKGYAPGPNILCHASNDFGERAAAVLQFRSA